MFFKKDSNTNSNQDTESVSPKAQTDSLCIIGQGINEQDSTLLKNALKKSSVTILDSEKVTQTTALEIECFLSLFQEPTSLIPVATHLNAARESKKNGLPVLIIAITPEQLLSLGEFLSKTASENTLSGLRLVIGSTINEISENLAGKETPILEPTVIRMPIAPEVENSPQTMFYAISPELRNVVSVITACAENNIDRLYLLGAPGSGKTSLAYYYWLARKRGRFVIVNLSAESTDDKASMKSLLCGHVAGSIAGSGAREGALSFAQDGVCFLDESHGVTGSVMQVLMEALDSGQFMPFGATQKRLLQCGVVFASNRSWEKLRAMIHLDEHARLGATIIEIPDLRYRLEDLIAVTSAALYKFSKRCSNWQAPKGLSKEAWDLVAHCKWRGNTRTLFRVMESACVDFAMAKKEHTVISQHSLTHGISLWEPEEHDSHSVYASYGGAR